MSTSTMHQSTTLYLSQSIWQRWASRQFPIVGTLLPVTFGYSLSSEAVVMRQLRRWKRLWRRWLTRSHEDFNGALQRLLEWYNKCIAAGGDYFEGDKSFMCVLSTKEPYEKSLETYLMILVNVARKLFWNNYTNIHIYIYIYACKAILKSLCKMS